MLKMVTKGGKMVTLREILFEYWFSDRDTGHFIS